MLKRYTAILMMTFAYAILLGHNIIPHHHHDNDHEVTEHHNHDDDTSSEEHNHPFSHFTHSADVFNFTTSHTTNILSKQLLSLVAILPDIFLINKFIIPSLLHKLPAAHLIYISPHYLSSGLRAPPAFIV